MDAATNKLAGFDSLKAAVYNTPTSLLQYNGLRWAGEHLGVAFPTVVDTAYAQHYLKGRGTDGVVFEAHFGGGAEYGVRCSLINAAALLACVGRHGEAYTGEVTVATLAGGGFEVSVTVDGSGVTLVAGSHRTSGQFHREEPPPSVVGASGAAGVMEEAWRWASAKDVPDRKLYPLRTGVIMFAGTPMASGTEFVGPAGSTATFAGERYFPVYAAAAKQQGVTDVGARWDEGAVYGVPTLRQGIPEQNGSDESNSVTVCMTLLILLA